MTRCNPSAQSIVNTITGNILNNMSKKNKVLFYFLETYSNENGYTVDMIATYASAMTLVVADINRGISQRVFTVSANKLEVNYILNDNSMGSGIDSVIIYNINLGTAGNMFAVDTTGALPVVSFIPLLSQPISSFITDWSNYNTGVGLAKKSFE